MKKTQPAKMDITCTASEGEKVIQVTRVQWRMDMTNDRLETGQPIQILTLIDMVTKQSPAVEIQKTFTRQDVVSLLDRLAPREKLTLCHDNGLHFLSKDLKYWAQHNNVKLVQPPVGELNQQRTIDVFIRKLKVECLDDLNSTSIEEAQQSVDQWRTRYNAIRSDGGSQK